jgi:hydroxymethylglutaryl-CoA synthase
MDYFDSWDRLIFHLPYAFHGKRIASELFMISMKKRGLWTNFSSKVMEEPIRENFEDDTLYESTRVKFLRSITKTEEYTTFVNEKLEKAQRASTLTGNMYACSIFLALMSTLESDLNDGVDFTNAKFGFFGYGSGSKSKVFEGRLQDTWKNVVSNFNVFQKLEEGLEIDYNQYERIHRKQITESIQKPSEEFIIEKIGTEGVRLGARYYKWQS